MVYNYVSSQQVIAKTFRDLNMQRQDWVTDAIEWMGEALDAIGTPSQLEDKARVIKTTSHRAPLPSDLYLIHSVWYGHGNTDKKPSNLTLEDFPMFMEYGNQELHPGLMNEHKDAEKGAQAITNETFLINGQYIQTSFESDYVAIVYKAFALDDDGFPMVPDMYEFKQALYWYIVMKLMEGGMKHPAGLNWTHAEKRWLKYCGQARAQANMPDIPKAARFREMWVTLTPQWTRDYAHERNNQISLEDLKSGTVETRPISS